MIRDKKSLGKKIWDSPLNPVKKFDNAIQVLSVPSALIAEGYEAYTGKGDGKFNFSDAMPKEWGFVGDGGKQKEIGNLMYPNADWKKQTAVTLATDPTTYITGGGALKGISTVGGKILKKAGKQIKKIKIKPMEKIGKFNMPHSPLNYKDEFDIDYSGAKAVDLGNVKASDFTKAKKKLVEGYKGVDNPEYQMEKGDYYWDKNKGKIRSGYLEYPEDAGDIDPRYLGKNWDNEEVYNMTPNATEAESKAVRDKFDATYMKRNK